MLFFAHTGITVGLTWLSQRSWVKSRVPEPVSIRRSAELPSDQPHADPALLKKAMPGLDYRWLLVGSMLPDIIDKPLGIWLLREALSNGRVFGHTLLFAGLLMAAGLYLYVARRRLGLLCLALGTLAHLILDEMWLTSRTLLWPAYGFSFEKGIVEDWLPRILNSLVTEPTVYVPEIIGALLLAVFFSDLIRRGRLTSFLRSGRVD
jgi:inner membrane protein